MAHASKVGTFDAEFGYSCMGYEISGALGAKMALPDPTSIAWVGDGSYLMMNSDIYSTRPHRPQGHLHGAATTVASR